MRAPTSIWIWLRIDSGMVQTHQSALACCGVAGLFGVLIGDRDAAVVLLDPRDLGVVADEIADFARERLADHVHAADRLEHGGLEFVEREILQVRHSRDCRMSDRPIGSPGTGAAPSPPPGSLS